ncbi:anthrone oxygenase family protein [Embleya hyalina]|uniref:Membrane protein n=1 Tax=Embleya hyalina TaxID=516124 RepID=A0A401YYU6_9ACTN|nr:anthrone oxygenase family protein [Embleya hyalina]GCD99767.1 membrane protein [Embleya hyalina]
MATADHTLAPAGPIAAGRSTAGRWLTAGAAANGLMAGTYVTFSAAVMPWLGTKGDADFVSTMQNINSGIENPLFFTVFTAAMAAPAIAAWKLRAHSRTAMRWALVALALYTTTVLTTSGINVPLNQALAHAGTVDPAKSRADFETTWNIWNGIRAVLSTAAAVAMVKAVRLHRRSRV